MTKIRTRFAPSPTGRMHVGNLRTALYAYLIAKHEDGDFILRIEDTDQERYMEGAVDIIYRTMKNTGLLHDEGPDKDGGVGPYVQSERQASGLYLKYAKQLIEQGDAYYCFCGPEELESMKRVVAGKEISIYDKRCLHLSKEEVQKRLDAGEPHVIRFNMPTEGTTTFHDVIYGDITVNNEEMEDLILIKSDGYPTYNFANVVDDHLMGITHVVRGNEYLSSAPKYNRIYEAFGWVIPTYVHCPLITDGILDLRAVKEVGFDPGEFYVKLVEYKEMLYKIFHFILDNIDGCLLFHCQAGKDRTGVLAMILMGLAGVSKEDIVANYEVTHTYLKENVKLRLEDGLEELEFSKPQWIEKAYDHIIEHYGSFKVYLMAVGLTKKEIKKIKGKLAG